MPFRLSIPLSPGLRPCFGLTMTSTFKMMGEPVEIIPQTFEDKGAARNEEPANGKA